MIVNKTVQILLIPAALSLMLLAAGCGIQPEQHTPELPSTTIIESEGEKDMENSIQLIMEAGKIDRDSAEGTVETLAEIGAGALESAELISEKRGIVLRVVDTENQVYYLGFGGLGYLELIRKDSADGEILYAPED